MDEREFHTFGPPGTGKTTWLIKQIERACAAYSAEEVLVASFTRAAARELVARGVPVPDENVGTLHALCHRILNRPKIAETKIKQFNEAFPQFAISSAGHDLEGEMCDGSGDDIMSLYQILRAQMTPEDEWPEAIQEFHRIWSGWCWQNQVVDFTGLLESVLRNKMPPPSGALIGFFDEAQDFTSLEFAVIRQWSQYMDKVIFVGDDDQAIYGFKGGDPDAFINYEIPEQNKIYLRTSYRLPSAILHYSRAWVEQISNREQKEFAPHFEGGSVQEVDVSTQNPFALAGYLQRDMEQGESSMVLTTCSYMLDRIKKVLHEESIPFHNPYRRTRADWNPFARGRSGGASATLRLLRFFGWSQETTGIALTPGDQQVFWDDEGYPLWTAEQFKSIFEVLSAGKLFKRGAGKELKKLREPRAYTEGYDPFYQNTSQKFMKQWLLPGKAQEIAKATHEHDYGLDWFEEHLLSAKAKPFEKSIELAKRSGVHVLAEEPKVVIGTIHSVKGGEADNVYLFPDISPKSMQSFILGGGSKDDTLRQFYVGMTRSQKNLYLCQPSSQYKVEWLDV